MISEEQASVFWKYLEFYPMDDEEGYDGVHDGGIKGIRSDAPLEAKVAYDEFLRTGQKGVKV